MQDKHMFGRLKKIEQHFHEVIRGRAAKFIDKHRVELPTLETLLLASANKEAWLPIPGMYGGFRYWLEGQGEQIKLISVSWWEERHEITAEGSKLVGTDDDLKGIHFCDAQGNPLSHEDLLNREMLPTEPPKLQRTAREIAEEANETKPK